MKQAKTILRIFGFLDIVSIALLSKQIYSIATNFDKIPDSKLSEIRITLLLISYLLLFVSAAGLLTTRKYGVIAYYIQFPIRLLVWVFSFGFITFISEYTTNPYIFDWSFRIAIILEFFRLYFTIKFHRNFFR
ncbi:MAG TPA: hypothetical protein DIT07_08720 [Sphingobacteriaceae bacterium]|nr:hypothetical protein [Sphingobacteriaceae bacterium]